MSFISKTQVQIFDEFLQHMKAFFALQFGMFRIMNNLAYNLKHGLASTQYQYSQVYNLRLFLPTSSNQH